MMQETSTIPDSDHSLQDSVSSQSIMALLALVGTRRMDAESLRSRTRLTRAAFGRLVRWLQKEYLVEVVSSLEGNKVAERVGLTEKGESVLLSMLEKTCELPELR